MAAAEEIPNLSQSSTRSLSYIETPASQEHRRLSMFKLLKKYLQKASSGDPTPSVYRDEIIGQVHNTASADPREKILRAETIADPVLKSVRETALVGPTTEKSDTLCIIIGTHGAYRSTEHNFSGGGMPFEAASMCLGQPPGLSFVMSEPTSNTMMEIICKWCQGGGSNTRQNQNFFSNSCNLCYNLSRADPVYSEAREAAVGKSRTKQSKCFKTRGFAKCLNEQEWMALVDDSKIMYAPINLKAGNIPDKLYTCLRDTMDPPTDVAPLWNNILFYDAESCLRSRPLLSLFEDEGSPYRGQYWNYIPWTTKSTIDPQLAELYSQLNKDVVSTPNVVFIAPNADAPTREEIVRKARVLTAPLDGFYATITGYHPQPHSVIFLTVAPMEATSWPYANYKSSAFINLPQLMAIAQDSPVNYGAWVFPIEWVYMVDKEYATSTQQLIEIATLMKSQNPKYKYLQIVDLTCAIQAEESEAPARYQGIKRELKALIKSACGVGDDCSLLLACKESSKFGGGRTKKKFRRKKHRRKHKRRKTKRRRR